MSRRVATNLNLKRRGAPGSGLPGLDVMRRMNFTRFKAWVFCCVITLPLGLPAEGQNRADSPKRTQMATDYEKLLIGAERPRQVPPDWRGEALPNGRGWRWFNPKNRGDSVRIYRGDPKASPPSEGPYVVVTKNGEVIGRDGKPTGQRLTD